MREFLDILCWFALLFVSWFKFWLYVYYDVLKEGEDDR